MGREVSQGTTTDSGDRDGDEENILPMPRGVDVSGARMGMEKRRFMSEEEENSLVDRALKSVGIGIDVVSRSQGQVQAYA